MEIITKVANKNYRLDITSQQLTFLDSRFYYTESGQFVPSVSTICEAYPKGYGFYKWLKEVGEDSDTIRDEAGESGSVVHNLTEKYDEGESINLMDEDGNISFKLKEWNCFEKYVEFRNRFAFHIVMSEQRVVSPTLGYAGTLDRVVVLNDKRILLDIKTSGNIWPSYWLQLSAYRNLLHKETGMDIDAVGILWLNAKTRSEGKKGDVQGPGWQLLLREDSTQDLKLFHATQALWIAENQSSKPKEISYKLSHQLQIIS